MRYGYFDDASREYVITTPRTPVKWINYVGTLDFGGFVDHTGGVLICKGDPTLNRITKYIQQMPASDFKGSTLYLRLKQKRGYKVFGPFYVPTLDRYDLFECHVGLGYTRIVSEFYGFHTEATIFVPMGESCLMWDIRITNVENQTRQVDAIPVVEYTHPFALMQYTNADWIPQTMQSMAFDRPSGRVGLAQFPFMFRDTRINYLTSNCPVSSFETDRRRFLGANEYGSWANPLSLQQGELSNTEAQRGDNIAALMHHLGDLAPGETRRLIVLLGQEANVEEAQKVIRRCCSEKAADRAFKALARFWDGYLRRMQVETPEPSTNSMLNIHNPRQCHTTKNWSRYLSYYQLGLGSRGIGFRDSSQDVMGVVAHLPDEARELMVKLLSVQKRNGSAMHQFNPMSMEASVGDAAEREDRPQYYSDDHLWVVLAVCAYLRETGDLAFLDRVVPFYEKDQSGQPVESGSVLDHLRRGIEFTWKDVGAHGLPLLGYADWNDTVNLPAGAESLFTANLFGRALRDLIDLAEYLGDAGTVRRYTRYYNEMRQRVNACAWDGEWYVRYFDADGMPLGSHTNRVGQIYTNGQSWPVISGFATPERAERALQSVYERLNTACGIKLSTPGYNGFDPTVGGVSTYPPGAKENGGIFLHANPWVIIAETMLGHGDRAYEYYRQINPAARNEDIDRFECEPYVYPQNILGDEHPQFGLARNSWLSGTASWMYQAATQYILGIRPTYQGLCIDPCIPAAWDGFHVRREFRAAIYDITVSNPRHVCKGVALIVADGQQIDGCVVPILEAGKRHRVKVTLG